MIDIDNIRGMKSKAASISFGLLLIAGAAGCSSDNGVTTGPPATTAGDTASGDTTVTPSGGVAADDFCHVDITGDVTASFDSPGGFSNISYGPWVPNTGATVLGIALDDGFFIMNCQGPDDQLLSIGLGLDQHLPMAPGTFAIRKADNIFGGYDSNPPVIQVSPFIGSSDFFWAISADSTFTITEFDAAHIAGNFQFSVSEAKNEVITDSTPAKTAVITGTFNLKNPN